MLPIAPLMIEHRMIERMIKVLQAELANIKESGAVNPVFIDNVVDFIRVYADQTHHGKEEDILFRELKKKTLSPEHERIMNELVEEHLFGRKTTGELVKINSRYASGDKEALKTIIKKIETLVDFYPKHIEKEDKHFFIPVMEYFSKNEQDGMLLEGQAFDRKMIHKKYNALTTAYENARGLSPVEKKSNWIDFL